MNILLVTSHLDAGGITSYTLSLARALKERGCEVVLASGGGRFEGEAGLPHFNIGIRTKCEIGPRVLKGVFKVRRIIERYKIDLVHAQTRVAGMTGCLASAWAGIPFLTTAHGFYRPHWGRRMCPCWGKAVIAISSQVLEHLKNDFHIPPSKIHLIHNGTDFSRFESLPSQSEKAKLLSQLGLVADRPLIGIVARLSPVKGHHYLLEAVDRLRRERPLQCLVVGDGPSRQEFLSELAGLNLDGNVRWIPWMDDPLEALSLLDVFVLPSLQEGLSLSILEAQAAGVPVVASNVGGISEVVIDGRTGILVPPKDSGALTRALKTLLENQSLAQAMGQAGREHIRTQFSLSRMVDQVIGVYERVLRVG